MALSSLAFGYAANVISGQPYQSTGSTKEPVEIQTLAELGIDKKLSSRSRKTALIVSEKVGVSLSHRQTTDEPHNPACCGDEVEDLPLQTNRTFISGGATCLQYPLSNVLK